MGGFRWRRRGGMGVTVYVRIKRLPCNASSSPCRSILFMRCGYRGIRASSRSTGVDHISATFTSFVHFRAAMLFPCSSSHGRVIFTQIFWLFVQPHRISVPPSPPSPIPRHISRRPLTTSHTAVSVSCSLSWSRLSRHSPIPSPWFPQIMV